VVVLGESSAEGLPYNSWLSVGAIIAWQPDELLPERRARLHMLARMGDTLEDQHRKLGTLTRRPDLLVVYCGHNEFASRLHPGREVDHYSGRRPPIAWSSFVDWGERVSPICGLIRETVDKCRLAIPTPPGRGTLIDVPAYTSGEFAALLADFHRRLEAIAAYAEQIGAILVLIVPPSNDADFEPNRSFLPASTSLGERKAFEREFPVARGAETTDPTRVRAMYETLLERQPGFAEAHYRLALILKQAGDTASVYRHFSVARDCDGYPVRCLGPFQGACRSVAARRGWILVDGHALFHAIGRDGLPDDHLFQDAMHPALRGHIALAQGVLVALRAHGAWGWPAERPITAIDPARCAAHFRMRRRSWKFVCAMGSATNVKISAWTHDGGERLRRAVAFDQATLKIEFGASPESVGLPNIGIPEPVPILPPTAQPECGDDSSS
jgi:hypothetical protein